MINDLQEQIAREMLEFHFRFPSGVLVGTLHM